MCFRFKIWSVRVNRVVIEFDCNRKLVNRPGSRSWWFESSSKKVRYSVFLCACGGDNLSEQMLLNELLTNNETFSNQNFITHQNNYKLPNNLAGDLSDSSSSSCNLTSLNQCQSNKFGSTDGELMKEKSKNAARSRREKENAEVTEVSWRHCLRWLRSICDLCFNLIIL